MRYDLVALRAAFYTALRYYTVGGNFIYRELSEQVLAGKKISPCHRLANDCFAMLYSELRIKEDYFEKVVPEFFENPEKVFGELDGSQPERA